MLVGTLYGALIVFVLLVFLPVALIFRVPLSASARGAGAVADRVLHRVVRGRAAARDGEHGGVRRPAADRRVRAADRLLVQPRRSTLYLAVASVFAAQAAGIDMPISTAARDDADADAHQQRRRGGAAGVARDPLGRAGTFGLPLQAVAVILGVDALMDMARTSINLVGNCLATR